MKVELQHHYGWKSYETDKPTLAEAAYAIVRQLHPVLTDDNHEWLGGSQSIQWGGSKLKWNSIRILRNDKSIPYSGPESLKTDLWFAYTYRKAS